LNRVTGEILDEALKGPVTLTKRGRDRLVLMPVETFQRLSGHHKPRAYAIDDLPMDVAADLDAALEQTLSNLSTDKP
jgi:prevent-host-death family protein